MNISFPSIGQRHVLQCRRSDILAFYGGRFAGVGHEIEKPILANYSELFFLLEKKGIYFNISKGMNKFCIRFLKGENGKPIVQQELTVEDTQKFFNNTKITMYDLADTIGNHEGLTKNKLLFFVV